MANANGAPRRVSMAYILGFSDKPYKEVKPPAPPPPPQPRKPSQPTNIITTPGRIMEWTASDGRKGKLTGAGKPRLTAASLAKVPSDKRSTKEALGAKSTSKKAASSKPAADGDNPWDANGWGATDTKSGSKKSGSKKDDTWNVDNSGNGNKDPSVDLRGNPADVSGGGDKKEEKKADTTSAWDTTASAPAAPSEEVEKKDENLNEWTREQDEKLMQMKTENLKTWAEIVREIGVKTKEECTDRFKVIKPEGWKPNDVNKGGEGKKGKNNGKKQNHNQNQGKGGNKKDEKKEEEKKEEAPGGMEAWDMSGGGMADGLFGDAAGGDTGDSKDDSGGKDTSWDNVGEGNTGADTNAWDTKGVWDFGNTTGGGDGANDGAVAWDFNSGGNWNTNSNNVQNKSEGGASGADPCTTTAPAQNSPSNRAPSQSRSQPNAGNNTTQPITARPLELEVKPDDTFSADDLRLVARILQQDCSMVWNRVSWRFRDKRGRTLHPDEFEKKITGRLEGKDSEKGERRR